MVGEAGPALDTAGRSAPAQVVAQQATILQELDGFQSVIGWPQEHGVGQAGAGVGTVEFLNAGLQRPGRTEAGQGRLGFDKADPIVAKA